MNNSQIRIIKADGEKEFFDRKKLVESLRRSGADSSLAEKITSHIESELINDMSTTDIYHHAFSILQSAHKPTAARYSLRRALVGFGPSGFPFEDYVGEIFRSMGWEVETGKVLMGSCVPHEVDVVGWKGSSLLCAEIKFHNEPGFKTDLKIALYVKARMDDLAGALLFVGGKERKLTDGYLITNTKFSSTAVQYGKCVGLKMIGWSYPEKESLEKIIESRKLHPLSCLTSLNAMQKQELFSKGIVLCKTLIDNKNVLSVLNLSKTQEENVLHEAKSLFSE